MKTSTTPVEPLRVICAWHPGFDKTAAENKGASHSICAACMARIEAEEAAS